ncbi:hypothetical protein ACK6V9_16195 [Proteus mirabilis]|uniref:hypothetical protein n=1 Tax=Proteus mirabilis TaxID=584 RepID=UPI002574E912|nr:hypothetical protein [Proteus mirabilis]MDM3841391.1 hypothetical protein [Proteus mirabilis]
MKEKLKRLIMDTLKKKASNQGLLLHDFSINIRTTLNVDINEHMQELEHAIQELEDNEFICFIARRNGDIIARGLYFDDYFSNKINNSVYNIGHIEAGNVQVGNNNTLTIERGLEELIDKLNNLNISEKDKENAKSCLSKVLNNPIITSILGGAVSGLLSRL